MDYPILIDAETWAFVKASEDASPPDAASRSIAEKRAIHDAMCRAFHRGYPAGIVAEDRQIASVPCRIFPGEPPAIIHLHGGGFVVGGLESHDDVCADIRAATGLSVVCPDYLLAPEHQHPAALEDALALGRAVAAEGPVLGPGGSAGGNLAAAVSHVLRGPTVLGQALIHHGLGGDMNAGSCLTHPDAPMLTREDLPYPAGIRHGGAVHRGDATVSPLQTTDFSGLTPTIVFGAECDAPCGDAQGYAQAITRAGWVKEPGLVHGDLRARHTVPRAQSSFARITRALSTLAKGEWSMGDTE